PRHAVRTDSGLRLLPRRQRPHPGSAAVLRPASDHGGEGVSLDEAAVAELGAAVRGELIRPVDATYEDSRRIWNGMIDKRPAIIARCAAVQDVVRAVDFARTHDLLIAVRGGGHN